MRREYKRSQTTTERADSCAGGCRALNSPVDWLRGDRLLDVLAAFFVLGDAFGFPELLDHQIQPVAFHDALQPFVVVAGSDHEPIALCVSGLVVRERQLDGLRAALRSALAEESLQILRACAHPFAHLLDFPIGRPEQPLVSRHVLITSIHSYGYLFPNSRGAMWAVEDEVVLVIEVAAPPIGVGGQPDAPAFLALQNGGDVLGAHATIL